VVIVLLMLRCIIRDLENNTETHYVIVLVVCVCACGKGGGVEMLTSTQLVGFRSSFVLEKQEGRERLPA
jgi:hypothetical protein